MPMNPIDTTKTIEQDYLAYLQSILTVKDAELTKLAAEELKNANFVKGPYLEATPPFVPGVTLAELINTGIASNEFNKIAKEVEINRPLYNHQELAFRKVVQEKKNIIVATGTGSGKTEAFIYPILNELMCQKEAGKLNDGVRTLLLYPMNALANDQMKRLRNLLNNYPDISFGRYTGETIEKEKDAKEFYKERNIKILSNEKISRESMRANPPNILLTNYAMLEYLLIRPDDSIFFDGEMAKNWKFIVLDEAHTYKGASGTEIAILLRRLKERICKNEKGRIQCIATSATLGNKNSLTDLAKFATDIFDEKFDVEDIITSQRSKRTILSSMRRFSIEEYRNLKKEIETMPENQVGEYLYKKLLNDERIVSVLNLLENNPENFNEVAKTVFSDYDDGNLIKEGLINLIELGVKAKPDEESNALLPARYHLFIRAIEGVYASLFPQKKVFLARKESYSINGKDIPVFELANCQNCRQEYLIGKEDNGYLKPVDENDKIEYFLLPTETLINNEIATDSDDKFFEEPDAEKLDSYDLCTACGKLTLSGSKIAEKCCEYNEKNKIIKIYKMRSKKSRDVNTCAACGRVSSGIIKRFMTANQPATYIIANSLYSMIPPQKIKLPYSETINNSFFDDEDDEQIKNQEYYDESGRKLLVFSDNRQEAAFFAAYMDNKYNQLMWRRLIINEISKNPDGLLISDLITNLINSATKAGLYSENKGISRSKKEEIAGIYLMKELTGFERKQGLEGSGYIQFYPEKPSIAKGGWGLNADELWDLCCVVMDSLRLSGAISYPDNINPEDEEFSPRNHEILFRKEGSGKFQNKYILSFLPVGSANNKRFDYIKKIFLELGRTDDETKKEANDVLNQVYDSIFNFLSKKDYFIEEASSKEGILKKLNFKKWMIKFIKDEEKIYCCNKCKTITTKNIKNICPAFRCTGKLEELQAKEHRNDPYYSKIYSNKQIIPMVSKEHTAQLSKDTAGQIQSKFESGDINVLSCSTTFEMGVDVGQLEAILLRNVPPETSNYIQRAGRAGRRTSATAFSVTYARRSSHDLNYFEKPNEIINGKIKAPYIEIENDKIASRHVNSIVLAWFFKKDEAGRGYFKDKVRALIGSDGREIISTFLKNELDKKPQELIDSIERVLSPYLMKKLGIKEWEFAERLAGNEGTLTNAVNMKLSDIKSLKESLDNRLEESKSGKIQYTDDLRRLINTLEEQQTINFLATSGVIPKYGFPVDVVDLKILDKSKEANEVDLSRDLKMAISDYAPESEVIAAGKIWTSYSLNKIRDKEWPTYKYYECKKCNITTISDGITTLQEQDDEEIICRECGELMTKQKFLVPIFGFSTLWGEKAKKVGENRPKKFYPTKVQFCGFDELDSFQKTERKNFPICLGDKTINAIYSPQGKLVLMNKGVNGLGLFICKYCGFAKSTPGDFSHKTKMGKDCPNKIYSIASIGHLFTSDILRIELPRYNFKKINSKSEWLTILYAILEGASDALGISRNDINGCLDMSKTNPALILFDESVGGAGHVKRISTNFNEILSAASKRVSGHCGCGEETSCYGCLRSYLNQLDHKFLARGLAKDYLDWLLPIQQRELVKY